MPKSAGAVLSDISDAWRQQNVDWLASYLADEFYHVIHIPPEMHPLDGACFGKRSVLFRQVRSPRNSSLSPSIRVKLCSARIAQPWKFRSATGTRRPGSLWRRRSSISGRSRMAGRSGWPKITTSPASRTS
jgi:hypothetical protein